MPPPGKFQKGWFGTCCPPPPQTAESSKANLDLELGTFISLLLAAKWQGHLGDISRVTFGGH